MVGLLILLRLPRHHALLPKKAFTNEYEAEMLVTYWQHTVGGEACAATTLSGYMCIPDRCPFGCRVRQSNAVTVTCDTVDRKDCAEKFRVRCLKP